MKVSTRNKKKGYTLIELSVVMVLVIMIAGTLTSMLSQQVQFLSWWNTQKFIAEDAPLVNNMVVRLFSQADAFRVHNTQANALNGTGGTLAGGTAVMLGFSSPNGGKEYGIINYNAANGSIEYSNVTNNNGILSIVNGDTWTMASGVAGAVFDVSNGTLNGVNVAGYEGVIEFTLTGPYGGQITYAASPSL
ncbi:type II secretion system protein [Rubritalea spongiae]|uniref:Type II secretion system protein n=1 Tax=Rubritalea spongiae TaxID=430797 RepID=A0ABW5E0S7_9BACT